MDFDVLIMVELIAQLMKWDCSMRTERKHQWKMKREWIED